ncbi:MAG: GNAT family N-acetyltransferase [Planctomycetota bacterium]|jgi:putative acetyltransferase
MMVVVRREQPRDVPKIREVNRRAFGQDQEALIVDRLRENCNSILSLVALAGNEVVGHILFSPAVIEGDNERLVGSGLAPLAVLPEYQRQHIGSELVQTGVTRIREGGCPYIIVLGHPEYYPRFGFEQASRYGIRSKWQVPDEAFMILILNKKIMKGVSGVAKYVEEWDEAVNGV